MLCDYGIYAPGSCATSVPRIPSGPEGSSGKRVPGVPQGNPGFVIMSYQVLARKWRPQVFEDVVGQGHITRTLQNAITTNRLAHAFLFSGPRGVGKTTTARILAKALNCKEGPTPSPCCKCDPCLETAAGTSIDVIEIDGASNRGIEHIRELREAVKYAPVGGKNKVYVIDEVHMLTNEAFNALLKTLEEPPPHVIFIFATTEPQKIPATIHSRCQRYGFKRISLHELTAKLRVISRAEGIKISDTGLSMIGRAAEGSMRDGQSLLDQAVSYSGLEVKDDDLTAILGTVSQEVLHEFASALLAKDSASLIKQVDALIEQGQDMRQLLSGAVEHIRNLLIAKISSDPGKIIELPASDLEAIKKQAADADGENLLLMFDSLSKTFEEMRWSPHQRFTLEIGIVKACSLAPLKPLSEIISHVKSLEERLLSAPSGIAADRHGMVRERTVNYAPQDKSSTARASGGSRDEAWSAILKTVRAKKPSLGSVLDHHVRLIDMTDSEIVLGVKAGFQMEMVEKGENTGFIEQVAAEAFNKTMRLRLQPFTEELKQDPKSKAPKRKKPEQEEPIVQDALRIFNGRITEDAEPQDNV